MTTKTPQDLAGVLGSRSVDALLMEHKAQLSKMASDSSWRPHVARFLIICSREAAGLTPGDASVFSIRPILFPQAESVCSRMFPPRIVPGFYSRK